MIGSVAVMIGDGATMTGRVVPPHRPIIGMTGAVPVPAWKRGTGGAWVLRAGAAAG